VVSCTALAAYRSSIKITGLLQTSADAYSKIAGIGSENTKKEPGDISGPFFAAALASEDLGGGKKAEIVWFPTAYSLVELGDGTVNSNLFINSLSYLCAREKTIVIDSKDLAVSQLSITSADLTTFAVVYLAILPVGVLLIGAVVVIRRKKR